MHEIRKIRRDGRDKPEQQRLRREDEREEKELQSYVAHSLARDMLVSMPGTNASALQSSNDTDFKRPVQQQEATAYNEQQFMNQHQPPSG